MHKIQALITRQCALFVCLCSCIFTWMITCTQTWKTYNEMYPKPCCLDFGLGLGVSKYPRFDLQIFISFHIFGLSGTSTLISIQALDAGMYD